MHGTRNVDRPTVKIFFFDVPVIGDAPELALDDGVFKFWTIVAQPFLKRWPATYMRETVMDSKGRTISLQQRVNDFFRDDAQYLGLCSLAAPSFIRPATGIEVNDWLSGHTKRVLE